MAAITRLTFLLLILSLLCPPPAPAQHELISNGSYLLSNGTESIEGYNQHQPLVPASTIKILTGLLALDSLGGAYRFTTRFYLDHDQNLWIQGGGDPFLTSENIDLIAQELKKRGVASIHHLILDDSLYQLEHGVNGSEQSLNPYDTEPGALAVNFNALPIVVDQNGQVVSSEPQTPTLPLMEKLGQSLPAGTHRVNVCAATFSNLTAKPALQYAGELFAALLRKNHIVVTGDIKFDTLTDKATPVFVYRSTKTVSEMLRACFRWSNNYVANQLFLHSGMEKFGTPANWEKALRYSRQYLQQQFHFTAPLPSIVEGSGLSRSNRISAARMMQILYRFAPFAASLLPHEHGVFVKSGTLSDVYCYVGYIPHRQQLYPFVIFLNQQKNSRDQLLQILKNRLATQP